MTARAALDTLNVNEVSRDAELTVHALVVWCIANPVSGGGRGKVMLDELAQSFRRRALPVPPRSGHFGMHDEVEGVAYHVERLTIADFFRTSVADHITAAADARHDVNNPRSRRRPATIFLLSTEGAGDGVRVAEHITRAVATDRLSSPSPRAREVRTHFVHVLVPIGGDGTLSEVVNGVCRGVIAIHHQHYQPLPPRSTTLRNDPHDGEEPVSSRDYYFRVLEEKSALRYLAPALLYMPTGTGADFAKLNLCVSSVADCVACLSDLQETLHSGGCPLLSQPAGSPARTDSLSASARVLSYYEVDVGRLTFPLTGRVHFFINECSFGMSCDVVERAERLRRTPWMAPLGGTVLFATSSLLSLLQWSPKAVRIMRLPVMPALPSWRSPSPHGDHERLTATARGQADKQSGVDEEAVAVIPTAVAAPRLRASVVPPPHLLSGVYAQRALGLDHACCVSLSTERRGTQSAEKGTALLAEATANAIRTHHTPFLREQEALETLNYYSGVCATPVASLSRDDTHQTSDAPRAFTEYESASAPANASFGAGFDLHAADTSGLPEIGERHPLFFTESGAPRPPRRTMTAHTVHNIALAPNALTCVSDDAKHVQCTLDLPEPVLARPARDVRENRNGHGATTSTVSSPVSNASSALPRWVQFMSSTISFGIGRWFGGGLHITPHADPADGLLSVTSWRAELIPFVARALSLYNGRHVHWSTTAAFDGERFILDAAAPEGGATSDRDPEGALPHDASDSYRTGDGDGSPISSHTLSSSAAPLLWMEADGELIEPLPAVIEVAGMLTFLAPLRRVGEHDSTHEACGEPLRFGPPVVGTTRAADWHACEDLMLAGEDPLAWMPSTVCPLPCSTITGATPMEGDVADIGLPEPTPEYVRLYVRESRRWGPAEDEGLFRAMAKSSAKWRACCGAIDHLCRVAQQLNSCVRSGCARRLHQIRWCLCHRREREEEEEDGLLADGQLYPCGSPYSKRMVRADMPV